MTPAAVSSIPGWLLVVGGAALGWLRSFWNRVYSATIAHAQVLLLGRQPL